MRNKKDRRLPYFTFAPNMSYIQRLFKDIDKIAKTCDYISSLNTKKYSRKVQIPLECLELNGAKGEIAYLKKLQNNKYQVNCSFSNYNLCIEYPLSLTAEEQRNWLRISSKFFKPYVIKESETVQTKTSFKNIVRKPHNEYPVEFYNPDNPAELSEECYTRTLTYAGSRPYGSKNKKWYDDIKRRNSWIRNRFKELRKDKSLSKDYARFLKLLEELENKRFGSAKMNLSLDAILKIVY